jgi:hypothetical protein
MPKGDPRDSIPYRYAPGLQNDSGDDIGQERGGISPPLTPKTGYILYFFHWNFKIKNST